MEKNIMARMNCICGEILSNSKASNNIELIVYTNEEWSTILKNDILETWKIPVPKYEVWKCPKCERIYVFKNGDNKAIKLYTREI